MAKKGKIQQSPKLLHKDERPVRSRKYKQFFLVVCEDQATEPAYFRQFQEEFEKIAKEAMFFKAVGTGKDPLGVVQQAIIETDILKTTHHKEIDFVWVVFDRDDAHLNATKTLRFQNAFQIAQQHKIEIAYSNEVFELWLLLHLKQINPGTPISRQNIYAELEQAIQQQGSKYQNFQYRHGDASIVKIIAEIGDEKAAIKKAQHLLNYHQQKGINPIDADPSTKVHELVSQLRAWLDYYQYDEN